MKKIFFFHPGNTPRIFPEDGKYIAFSYADIVYIIEIRYPQGWRGRGGNDYTLRNKDFSLFSNNGRMIKPDGKSEIKIIKAAIKTINLKYNMS